MSCTGKSTRWHWQFWGLITMSVWLAMAAAARPQNNQNQTVPDDQHGWGWGGGWGGGGWGGHWGGTPGSYETAAQAEYLSAYGNMAESLAYARKINAEAFAVELQNSIAYVDAYFKCRELNRQWHSEENPDYLEQEKHHQEVLKRKMKEQYQDLLKSDVTQGLNWLLQELSGPTLACRYLPPEHSLVHSEYDTRLTPHDIEQVRLTDGGRKGSQLVFHAGDSKPLDARWPPALRAAAFNDARTEFEAARDAALKEIRENHGPVSDAGGQRLIKSVNELLVQLESAYPHERRLKSSEFVEYLLGKQFLSALASAAHRAITTNDRLVFEGGAQFKGESAVDLIQFMYQDGLLFAPPEPGAEGAYRKLFEALRTLYLTVGTENNPFSEKKADAHN